MRQTLKLISKSFPVVGSIIILRWTLFDDSQIFQGSSTGKSACFLYAALFAYAMEFISRYSHAYLWHGKYLWWIHGSHHHQKPKFGSRPTYEHDNSYISPAMESNDSFAVFFASIAIYLMWYGTQSPLTVSKYCSAGIGLGVTIYGFSYFIGHDIVAHERLGKGVAQFLRRVWPYLDNCAKVHVRYHHTLSKRDDDRDPFGPPYGFWLGPLEVEVFNQNQIDYLPMPFLPKLCVWTSLGFYFTATVVEFSGNKVDFVWANIINNPINAISLVVGVISITTISISNMSYASIKKDGSECFLGRLMGPLLTRYSHRTWKYIHSIGEIAFGFAAIGLSAIECCMYAAGRLDDYFQFVFHLDNCIALPSLALATLSGLAMTYRKYFAGCGEVPFEIEYTFRLLNLFGLFWLVVDKSVQYLYRPDIGAAPPFWVRLITNVVSGAIYLHMRNMMQHFARGEKSEKVQ